MGVQFNVKHGAPIRFSLPVSTTDSLTTGTAWNKGRVFTLDATGNAMLYSNNAKTATVGSVVGLGLEKRAQSTQVGPYTTLTVAGAPTGERTSLILDEAVVVNDELQSGVAFSPGQLLYTSLTGFVTTSGNGTGAGPGPIIGAALSQANAGDPNRVLTMFFSVSY